MTPLERAKDFRRRYAHLLAGTSSADWSAPERDLARAVASGDVAYLCALSEHLRDDPEPWFATQGERAFLGLVLVRTDESLRSFLRGADRPLHGWEAARPLARETARRRDGALLGYALGDAGVVAALRHAGEGEASREVMRCFVQERVTAGGDLAGHEDIGAYWERAKDGSALGLLPLSLLPLERGALEPPPHTESLLGGYAFRCEPYAPPRKDAPPTLPVVIEAVREATAEETSTIGAVMGHHPLFPNARVEAHVLTLAHALPNAGDHASVVGLSLPCLEDPEPGSFFEEGIDAREVFGRLIKVATEGGCYGKGQSAAYGRLYAWQSLCALVDLPWGTALATIEEEAKRASFTWFRLHGPWYINISVDLGLACMRSDRRTLVVLAGTDCD